MLKRWMSFVVAVVLLLTAGAALAEAPLSFDMVGYLNEVSGLDLTAHRGKVILLHFFTAGDEAYQAQLSDLKRLYDAFDPEGVAIVMIHAWDGEDGTAIQEAKAALHLEEMTIYEDEGCALSHLLGLTAFPNTLFIDSAGNPASGYGGTLHYDTLAQELEALGVANFAAVSE